MKAIRTLAACSWALALVFSNLASGAPRVCTQEEAKIAEEASTSLADWGQVYDAFKKFGQCDDGGIAEGYSDSIGRLLSTKWDQVGRLNELALSDPAFRRFVLRHIDETLSVQELAQIQGHAVKECPKGAKALCHAINKSTR